ncbi:unnamed protein product [Effrenium voratum]|nr:unnamed protein product [Effrenium voratum]
MFDGSGFSTDLDHSSDWSRKMMPVAQMWRAQNLKEDSPASNRTESTTDGPSPWCSDNVCFENTCIESSFRQCLSFSPIQTAAKPAARCDATRQPTVVQPPPGLEHMAPTPLTQPKRALAPPPPGLPAYVPDMKIPPPPMEAPRVDLEEDMPPVPAREPCLRLTLSDYLPHHDTSTCRPCAFFHTRGCENGSNCSFCHLCPPGEKKRRQKLRRAQEDAGKPVTRRSTNRK